MSALGPVAAGIAATFGAAAVISSASAFDSTMHNIQAVTKDTAAETAALGQELLAIGGNSVAGPQAVADAYYDIAGGVADASVRMDTLNAAIALSEAGQANLGAATAGLISVMNSYGFSAEQASFASDVLTRTVGMGVGTMGDFASALPQVTGLANSMGISFDDLAASADDVTDLVDRDLHRDHLRSVLGDFGASARHRLVHFAEDVETAVFRLRQRSQIGRK